MKKLFLLLSILCSAFAGFANDSQAPKYVFYFIGDGMGLGHVNIAQTYWRTHVDAENPLTMYQFPIALACNTYSAKNHITDSAAAGSALSTGTKTRNGMLGMDADTVATYSVALDYKNKGYGIAIATSVYPDDATPGAFYTHVPARSMYTQIGFDMAKSQYDMFAGSSLRGLKDKKGNDTGLKKALTDAGYVIAHGPQEYEKVKNSDKIILLSTNNTPNIGFTIDSIPGALTLPFITKACIEHEMRVSPDKFFMMIEGGNIDWAAHANDGGCVVKEIINFNECIKQAYDFYLQHPDETLIIVTADHNTGGMSLGVVGGPHYHANLDYLDYQKISISEFQEQCNKWKKDKAKLSWDEMKAYLGDKLGLYSKIELKDTEDEELQQLFNDNFVLDNQSHTKTLYSTISNFVTRVFEIYQRHLGIGWTTYSHCGDMVPFFAIGKGSEQFLQAGKHNTFIDNTDIPKTLRSLLK